MLGQITPTINLTVKAGYGDTLLPDSYGGDDYRSVIGQIEMTYRSGTTFISAGYVRNFQPVVMFVYFGQDRVYARYRQQLAGKFTITADLGFSWLAYGDAVQSATAAMGARSDGLVIGGLAFNYHIQDWVEVGLAYGIQARFSDWNQVQNAASVDYNKHIFTLHAGVDY